MIQKRKTRFWHSLILRKTETLILNLMDLTIRCLKKVVLSDADLSYLVDRMLKDGYLTGNIYAFKYDSSITPFLESGGYVGRDARIKKEAERQKAIDQKTQNDGKLAKWQVKTFWPAFIFTLIGSALGIISFFMQIVLKSPSN